MSRGRGAFGPGNARGWAVLSAGIFFSLLSNTAGAEGMRGNMTLTYADLKTTSTDVTGAETAQENRTVIQLYNLNMEKNILPLLKLSVGGTLQKNDADVITGDARNSYSTTLTRPSVDLTLNNPLLYAGTGFNRVSTESTSAGVRAPTQLLDTYHGFLGWKPSELPSVDLNVIKSENYDQGRVSRDVFTNQLSLFSRYEPVKSLQVQYQGSAIDTQDRIRDLETNILSHNGRISYADRLLNDRVSLSSTYDVSRSSIETISKGAGAVDFQQFAFDGLFVISNIPNTVQLVSTPFLIDNDVSGTANNAVNIGSAPFTSPQHQDTSPRNIGLRFGIARDVNTMLLWVNSGASYLTPAVAASFSWSIYTSTDNQNWTLYYTIAAAPYEINAALPGVGRFELTFPNVQALWIKVVVNPLPAIGEGLLFPNIGVTELQAFTRKTAADVQGTRTGTNQAFTLYTKVNLLNSPSVYYDFSYFTVATRASDVTQRRSTAANGLSASHRFNRVLSGMTRLERVDDTEPFTGKSVSYNYSASLQATPLPTLRNSVAYGLNVRETTAGRSNTNSLFASNTAELYTNVNAFLNGGWTVARLETDQTSKATTYSYGIGLVPTKKVTITVSVTDQQTTQTGGGQADTSIVSRRQDGTVAYMPFSTLYLTAEVSRIAQGELRDTEQNYGVNWSPFPGGALQLGFSYSESRNARDNSINRLTQPNARWIISRWASADATYISSENRSDLGNSSTRGVSCNFRAIF